MTVPIGHVNAAELKLTCPQFFSAAEVEASTSNVSVAGNLRHGVGLLLPACNSSFGFFEAPTPASRKHDHTSQAAKLSAIQFILLIEAVVGFASDGGWSVPLPTALLFKDLLLSVQTILALREGLVLPGEAI